MGQDLPNNEDGMISLEEILAKQRASTHNFIKHLETEETGERIESVDAIRNEMKAHRNNTIRNKHKFIEEIKNGLGEDIIKNKAYGVKIKKRTLMDKIKDFFSRLYSNF
jgi:hypothetical protein